MVSQTEAIKAIYDAALGDTRWTVALDSLVDVTQTVSAVIYDTAQAGSTSYSASAASHLIGSKPEAVAAYNQLIMGEEHSGFEVEGYTAGLKFPTLQAVPDDQLFDINEAHFERPEMKATETLFGFSRRFLVRLNDDPTWQPGLIMHYGSGAGGPFQEDMRRIEALSGHVARALEVHRLTHDLRTKYRAVLSVLDMIDLPILLLSGGGSVIVKNRAAGDILSARDALWLSTSSRLEAREPGVKDAMDHAIARVSETARGAALDQSFEIEIPRGDASPPVFAIVSPLRDANMELESGLTGAFMTLIDPAYPVRPRVDLAATAYGLTEAEARVAELVVQGKSNVEIADRLGVGPETVKTQLQAVFDKTGCRSRLAFLWRIFQFSPPVR